MKRLISIPFFLIVLLFSASAGEGLWLPLLIDSLNYRDMQSKGLRLTPEEIYSVNQSSLKDAVVIFGGGCTGEIISPEGLLITNHHCGYSSIQSHSTVEQNYLANGFWAFRHEDELPNPGLKVSFLVRMEDVTKQVLENIPDSIPEVMRNSRISGRIAKIEANAIKNTIYVAEVEPFYFGKAYYLFIYEVFKDVRLVGAPQEAIGQFGGITDNWMWPRQTGDFSLFRIYADKNNNPAEYSSDNVPYKPKKYLSISLRGISEGDFTMVIGYPGQTDEYLTSQALRMLAQNSLPAKIQMRSLKLNALDEEMKKSPEAKLKLSAKYVSISNAWKKWIGVVDGIKKLNAVSRKEDLEKQFSNWVIETPEREKMYGNLMNDFSRIYKQYDPLYVAADLGNEMLTGIDLFRFADNLLANAYILQDSSENYRKITLAKMKHAARDFYNSNIIETERKIIPGYLKIYYTNTSRAYQPQEYSIILDRFGNDYNAYTNYLFSKSIFTDSVRLMKVLNNPTEILTGKLLNDPVIKLYKDFVNTLYFKAMQPLDSFETVLNKLYRTYITGLMEMDTTKIFYPDANFTMRITYGKVEGYKPADAVDYLYYSTLDGIIEKDNPDIKDYIVPEVLKDFYKTKDYGRYGMDGKLPVCFIASNHTSGGNSGSPVLNGDGQLIGVNFDRNWEGTISDYYYSEDICRNISLDIRYVLFIIDKIGGAKNILDEMDIIE